MQYFIFGRTIKVKKYRPTPDPHVGRLTEQGVPENTDETHPLSRLLLCVVTTQDRHGFKKYRRLPPCFRGTGINSKTLKR